MNVTYNALCVLVGIAAVLVVAILVAWVATLAVLR